MESLGGAGYTSVGIGKMHFSPWERMAGFHRRIIADRKGNWKGDNDRLDDYARFLAGHGLTRWDYLKLQEPAEIFGVYDWPYDPSLHIDAYVGAQARTCIENDLPPSPWFLWVSFNGPHNPWDPPSEYSRMYLDKELPRAKWRQGELATKPKEETRVRFNYTRQVVDLIDRNPDRRDEIIHRIRAGHYGGLTFIDKQLDGIFDTLEKKGILDETLILFSSDHGSHLGDHDLIHKGTIYDSSARVPFIVHSPGRIQAGTTRAFAGHVDIMPTLLSLAGAPLPPGLEGTDLSPVLLGKAPSVQSHVIIEIRGGTGIVTDKWKMMIYPKDGDGALYDLAADPDELTNLYVKPGFAAVRKQLLETMRKTNPALEAM
jgi:arylsulfatase A-like enzyme